jgi:hypothetical protein
MAPRDDNALKTALAALGPDDQLLTPTQLAGLDQFHLLGRSLMEGRLGILTAVFEAASLDA